MNLTDPREVEIRQRHRERMNKVGRRHWHRLRWTLPIGAIGVYISFIQHPVHVWLVVACFLVVITPVVLWLDDYRRADAIGTREWQAWRQGVIDRAKKSK